MNTPNIIFIVLDTLRADRVLDSNNNKDLTPFLKTLLKNSIYFKNCVANCAWTLPSHISMFTGLYSTENKIINNQVYKLSKKTPVLTEILKKIGYSTICYSENPWISRYTGLTRGFNIVYKAWNKNLWYEEKYKFSQFLRSLKRLNSFIEHTFKIKSNLNLWSRLYHKLDSILKSFVIRLFTNDIIYRLKNKTLKDFEIFSKILEDNLDNKPIYLFFNLMAVHDPYIPLQKYMKLFNIKLKNFRKIKEILISPIRFRLKMNIGSKKFTEKTIKVINNLYNACVYSADSIVKELFSLFEKLGLLKNSYIIITSDHGEHLGSKLDHFLWEHSTYLSLYESVIRVPLIIFNSNFSGKVIKDQVQLKDLFHTILHLTGIPESQNKFLDLNNSILYQIENKSTPKYIYGEFLKNNAKLSIIFNLYRGILNKKLIPKIKNDLRYIRTNQHKYIKYDNISSDEFYNIIDDIHEQNIVINEYNQIYNEMKNKMENIKKTISNPKNIKNILILQEKNVIRNAINKKNIQSFFGLEKI